MRGLKNVRLKQYDYRGDGYYFVTITANRRRNYFQSKEELISSELRNLTQRTKGLELDYFVIMPNHVHIIFVLKSSVLRLGEIVRQFKAKVSYKFKKFIWQPNYYEHVIRNEKALNKIREYIMNNPQVEILDFKSFYGDRADKSADYNNHD